MNQLKEDKQAFGLLVGKETSPAEIQRYPLTSLPFTLSDPSGKFQQKQKAPFINYSISKFKAMVGEAPTNIHKVCDGVALARALPIKPTWKELADTFLEILTPQEHLNPASVQTNMGTYDDGRIVDTKNQVVL